MIDSISTDGIFKNYINGEWVLSNNNALIDIKDPVENKLMGKVVAMQKDDIDTVVKSAKDSQKDWANTPMYERIDILNKVADILEENIDFLGKALSLEVAKEIKSAKSEIVRTADLIRFTCEIAKGLNGEAVISDSYKGFDKSKMSLVRRDPIGVVLAISPFNYPVNLAISKIVPALVMGNTVVFKSATQGVIIGLYLARVFDMAGLPKGVLNTVTGRGRDIGDYIVTHKDINFINFTGSTEVGKSIAKQVEMKPILMELGGKDAAIVLEDADLELTANQIIGGAFSYSGQRCTATKRVIVVDKVADDLVVKLTEKVKSIKVGYPKEEGVVITPLIDSKSADFVCSLVEDAKQKGAKILSGGKREGNLVYPTLIDNVTIDMDIAWEEPFGPILPIIRVRNKDEAIKIANESEYGLQSSVFTNNINDAFYIANKLEVGTVQINNKSERGPDHFPFLGVKASGVGVQGVKYSIEAMTTLKSIVLNFN